jgi:hypothetical protein
MPQKKANSTASTVSRLKYVNLRIGGEKKTLFFFHIKYQYL